METNLPIQSHPSADAAWERDGRMMTATNIVKHQLAVLIRREKRGDDLFSRSDRRRLSIVTQSGAQDIFAILPSWYHFDIIFK